VEYLARSISIKRWKLDTARGSAWIRADAVTNCLKTQEDVLSFWECNLDKNSIDEVATAIASGFKTLEGISIILLAKTELEAIGCNYNLTDGETPLKSAVNKHMDVGKLGLDDLSKLARLIAQKVRTSTEGQLLINQYTQNRLLELIGLEIKKGNININSLNEKLAEKFK